MPLVLRHRLVDRVRVREVVQVRDLELAPGAEGLPGQRARAEVVVEGLDERVGALGRDLLVVVAREEGAAVDGVVAFEQLLDADELVGRLAVGGGEDVEPGFGCL